ELAVKDLMALLAFLDTPEDNLSLAAALRSPLFGVSEKRLFQLANPRKGFLWEALRHAPGWEAEMAVLSDLRDLAEFLRPHELLERILTRHDGRRRLLARLGEEASDGIDELLTQALAFEQVDVPNLTGFLVWMASGEVEAKRQAETEGRRIRVMTVHGSKGLEAPIVILPETVKRKPPQEGSIYPIPDGPPIWGANKPEATAQQLAAMEETAARREAEDLRLLYVAVTRARCWLIVAAAGKVTEDCWYGALRETAETMGILPLAEGRERIEFGDWPEPETPVAKAELAEALPAWLNTPVGAAVPAPKSLSPSDLGGAKTVAGEVAGDPEAMARGTVLHQFLERFPMLDGEAQDRLGKGEPEMAAKARALVSDPQLAWIFGPGSAAEVGFAVPLAGQILSGTVDRLIVTQDGVTVVDYKSNAVVPERVEDVPEGYLRQLGAYAHAMGLVYPGRAVRVAILWTETATLMWLDPEIVREAFGRTAIP
ncbi:MAG: 3'-5' exonuclease, partial [Tabrizicola sp.]